MRGTGLLYISSSVRTNATDSAVAESVREYRRIIQERMTKIERELGWRPAETFETGLNKTVRWYLENRTWWERVRSGSHRGERPGLGAEAVT